MESVKEVFEESLFKFEDDAPLHRCVLLLHEYFQSPLELAEAYEIFTIQKGIKTKTVNEANLTKFEAFHRKTTGGGVIQTPLSPPKAQLAELTTPMKKPSIAMEAERVTPKQRCSPTVSPYLTPSRSFSSRKKKGQTLVKFNEHLTFNQGSENQKDQSISSLEVIGELLSPTGKILDDRLESKIAHIENRILNFIQIIEEHYSIDLKTPMNQPFQDAVWVCGMVCCDSDGRLNSKSIRLLGSQNFSSGASVEMDVERLPNYSLFPGQIIAIKAQNLTGQSLVVSDLICHLPAKLREIEGPEETFSGSVLTACGPYSSSEDLVFAALTEILQLCETQYFDLVILLGPFVDIRHPLLKQGDIDLSFDEIYLQFIVPILAKIEVLCGQLIIIPGLEDAHVLPVFPQPHFTPDRELQRTGLWMNPCVFKWASLIFGVCSVDIIKSLSMSVCEQQTGEKQDRIGLLLKHLLGQRSFYPLFPPMIGACLDSSLSSFLDLPVSLDLLICPSDLHTFVKTVPESTGKAQEQDLVQDQKYCICVNPGRVVRGSNGGTYAVINISQTQDHPINIQESIKVEIIGI